VTEWHPTGGQFAATVGLILLIVAAWAGLKDRWRR